MRWIRYQSWNSNRRSNAANSPSLFLSPRVSVHFGQSFSSPFPQASKQVSALKSARKCTECSAKRGNNIVLSKLTSSGRMRGGDAWRASQFLYAAHWILRRGTLSKECRARVLTCVPTCRYRWEFAIYAAPVNFPADAPGIHEAARFSNSICGGVVTNVHECKADWIQPLAETVYYWSDKILHSGNRSCPSLSLSLLFLFCKYTARSTVPTPRYSARENRESSV